MGKCKFKGEISGVVKSGMQKLGLDPPPIVARFDLDRQISLWGNASGAIHVNSERPGIGAIIVHDSLACLAVSFEHGVMAHSNSVATLGCHRFQV